MLFNNKLRVFFNELGQQGLSGEKEERDEELQGASVQ